MRGRGAAVLVALGIALGGCGGDDQALGEVAAIELSDQVEQLRGAAEAGRADDARSRLAALRATVDDLRARGEVSDSQADRILDAAAEVESALGLITTTTAPPPPTTARAPATTSPPEDDEPDRSPPAGRGEGGEQGDEKGDGRDEEEGDDQTDVGDQPGNDDDPGEGDGPANGGGRGAGERPQDGE